MLDRAYYDADQDVRHIDYCVVRQCSELLAGHPELRSYLTPVLFMKVSTDLSGRVDLKDFMDLVGKMVKVSRTSAKLLSFDPSGHGFLRECDLDQFVSACIPDLPKLSSLQLELVPFYVHFAVRRMVFTLDTRRTGKMAISDILSSEELLDDFMSSEGWFNAQSFMRMYTSYLDMDVDGNGMLSKGELARYPAGLLTPVVIDRIFQEHQTYESEMDFKGYLDLMLVLDNKAHPASIGYVWKLLDVNKQGKVGQEEFGLFHKSILETLAKFSADKRRLLFKPIDLFHESMDMMQIVDRDFITMKDLVASNQGGLVLNMLLDAHAFYLHDNRESLLLSASHP